MVTLETQQGGYHRGGLLTQAELYTTDPIGSRWPGCYGEVAWLLWRGGLAVMERWPGCYGEVTWLL